MNRQIFYNELYATGIITSTNVAAYNLFQWEDLLGNFICIGDDVEVKVYLKDVKTNALNDFIASYNAMTECKWHCCYDKYHDELDEAYKQCSNNAQEDLSSKMVDYWMEKQEWNNPTSIPLFVIMMRKQQMFKSLADYYVASEQLSNYNINYKAPLFTFNLSEKQFDVITKTQGNQALKNLVDVFYDAYDKAK